MSIADFFIINASNLSLYLISLLPDDTSASFSSFQASMTDLKLISTSWLASVGYFVDLTALFRLVVAYLLFCVACWLLRSFVVIKQATLF